ncbi:MAG: hypothetical protein Q4G40_02925 [Brachybacterium sp.]|nr:hypothetical protein [Brachybacterium sp.]
MTSDPGRRPEDDDAAFAALLRAEGYEPPTGSARREDDPELRGTRTAPDDAPPGDTERLSVREHSSTQSHPEATDTGTDEDDAVLGDFEPPDPPLPTVSAGTGRAWALLISGLMLVFAAATVEVVPTWIAPLAGATAVAGLLGLLLRVPTKRREGDDGAEV